MKKSHFMFAILTIFIVSALFTNPSLERQNEILTEQVVAFIKKDLSKELAGELSNNPFATAGVNVATRLASSMIKLIVAELLNSDNYLLFSTTKIRWEGKDEFVGVAAFNTIFFFKNLDDLKQELLKEISENSSLW